MTEEITEFEPSISMTPETFSFFDVLEEVTYPKDVISVYTNEAAAIEFQRLSREIDTVSKPTKKQIADFEQRATAIRDAILKSKYTFYLTGVSDDRVTEAGTLAQEHFKDKRRNRKTATGAIETYLPEEYSTDYLRYLNAIIDSLHIEQIVREVDGRVMTAPGPDEVAHFLDKAPGSEKAKLNVAIQGLRAKASDYERALDEGFFPKP